MHQFSGKLLIIDDDTRHTELLRDNLSSANYFLYINGLTGGAPETRRKC
jgi:hypothetical protein